ncbi:MAG TPA: cell wall hydrolase [Candidatus Omnitrophota bacterium]|nr:cell wall hydrolase [Candidatus Omnitrophota bacterium]
MPFVLPAALAEPVAGYTIEETILARTIYGEASGEKRAGRVAIANVIMNRVAADLGNDGKPDWWGEGVIEVCLKPWQFSCWNPTDPNRPRILLADRRAHPFGECLSIAREAVAGRLDDITGGAVQYLNVRLTERLYGSQPNWVSRMRHTVVVGRHHFYAL